jgi:hypothetical protein
MAVVVVGASVRIPPPPSLPRGECLTVPVPSRRGRDVSSALVDVVCQGETGETNNLTSELLGLLNTFEAEEELHRESGVRRASCAPSAGPGKTVASGLGTRVQSSTLPANAEPSILGRKAQ